ncbi:MAG: hypothetical protein SF069_07640 [Phycisphaerae bacterium]|nr:hypothetical protein [Phycisphaerae bacterium]
MPANVEWLRDFGHERLRAAALLSKGRQTAIKKVLAAKVRLFFQALKHVCEINQL